MRLALAASLLISASTAYAQGGWPSISGRVVDAETGTPIEGARVDHLSCQAIDRPETCVPNDHFRTTGPLGTFNIWSIHSHAYTVRVRHPGYCDATIPPYDELARHLLVGQLRERLNAPITSQTTLTDDERQPLVEERDRFVDEVLPVPYAQIALRRPPCTTE